MSGNCADLVYDIGLHKGEDTDFYLRKGFRVVAVEANPDLVRHCHERFSRESEQGRLTIIEGAIAPATANGKVAFFVNKDVSVWGTIDGDWAKRNADCGKESIEVVVDRVDLVDIINRHGMPFYLKIDVEGADGIALSALREFAQRPQYISIEANNVSASEMMNDMECLSSLGYKYFQIVPQASIGGAHITVPTLDGVILEYKFAEEASGPFGDDLDGYWTPLELIERYLPCNEWADIHAAASLRSGMHSLSQEKLSDLSSRNLALGRPALQSSTSAWSTSEDPRVDARVANNGDTTSSSFFPYYSRRKSMVAGRLRGFLLYRKDCHL